MQIKLPKPFFFEEGKRAVLLLHGFTGNSSDVRQLGRFLQKKGYTSYAPQYEGHAAPPLMAPESPLLLPSWSSTTVINAIQSMINNTIKNVCINCPPFLIYDK